tara:strand:+ start:2132 stop:3331 length:1200 start_codon:yes stop_codon:yes gene_type:complete
MKNKKTKTVAPLGKVEDRKHALKRANQVAIEKGINLSFCRVDINYKNGHKYGYIKKYIENEDQAKEKDNLISFLKLLDMFEKHFIKQIKLQKVSNDNVKLVTGCNTIAELEEKTKNGSKLNEIKTYKSFVNDTFKTFFSRYKLHQINKTVLLDFLYVLQSENQYKKNTLQRYFTYLKKILDYALDNGYIKALPKFPKIEIYEERPKPDTFTDDDLQLIMAYASNDLFFVFFILNNTGLRPAEFYQSGIIPPDKNNPAKGNLVYFDLEKKTINIRSYQQKKLGRIIPMPTNVAEAISDRKKRGLLNDYINPFKKVSHESTKRCLEHQINKLMNKIHEEHGINSKITLKKFRATFESRMLQDDVDSSILCKYLGHSQSVQIRHYASNAVFDNNTFQKALNN